jgi:purine/pyrimidine-nucleoside phosphorylase
LAVLSEEILANISPKKIHSFIDITKEEGTKMIKHNTYFNGKVQSLGINTAQGYATLGVMEPGTYTFSTTSEEHMVVIEGSMKVRLPGEDWQDIVKNEKITVAKDTSFDIDAVIEVGYICYYK